MITGTGIAAILLTSCLIGCAVRQASSPPITQGAPSPLVRSTIGAAPTHSPSLTIIPSPTYSSAASFTETASAESTTTIVTSTQTKQPLPKSTTITRTPIAVPIVELHNLYDENRPALESLYVGKVLIIKGVVTKITEDRVLHISDANHEVLCRVEPEMVHTIIPVRPKMVVTALGGLVIESRLFGKALALYNCSVRSLFIAMTYTPTSTPTPAPPTVTPIPTKTLVPTSTSIPTETPTPTPVPYVVANTDGDGVYIRRSPDSADRIKAWPEGARMIEIAGTVVAGNMNWRNVTDPDGNEGFVPAQYLIKESSAQKTATSEARRKIGSALTATVRAGNTCTAATRQYEAVATRNMQSLTVAALLIAELFAQVDSDPLLLLNPEWKSLLTLQVATVEEHANAIIAIDPSDPLASRIHAEVSEGSRLYLRGASLALSAVDSLDSDILREADRNIKSSAPHWKRAGELLAICD